MTKYTLIGILCILLSVWGLYASRKILLLPNDRFKMMGGLTMLGSLLLTWEGFKFIQREQ